MSAKSNRLKPKASVRKERRELYEYTAGTQAAVDREQQVIPSMKILGIESRNGRRYSSEAMKTAASLYEGRPAYCNHPIDPASGKPKPGRVRIIEDAIGTWKNVNVRPDGLYADLHYLKSHPMAERICEAAERMPNLYGCSHNAVGDGEYKAGVFEISSIPEVRSVDIVCDPGTTNGLFEQRETPMRTWKQVFESLTTLHKSKKAKLTALMEDDMMPADMPMPEVEPEESAIDPDAALKDGFRAAIMAVVDGEMDAAEKVAKIKALIMTHDKLTATPAEEPMEEPVVEEEEDEKKKDEATEQTVKKLKAELSARELCEQHEMKPTKHLVQALAALPQGDREPFLLETKALSKVKAPRSGSPGFRPEPEQHPTDVKSFVSAIRE